MISLYHFTLKTNGILAHTHFQLCWLELVHPTSHAVLRLATAGASRGRSPSPAEALEVGGSVRFRGGRSRVGLELTIPMGGFTS